MSEPPQRRIAVVGLGYVGLPVALSFARKFEGTVGFAPTQPTSSLTVSLEVAQGDAPQTLDFDDASLRVVE